MIASRINSCRSQSKVSSLSSVGHINLSKSKFSTTNNSNSILSDVVLVFTCLIIFLLTIFNTYKCRKQGKLITSLEEEVKKLKKKSEKWFFQRLWE